MLTNLEKTNPSDILRPDDCGIIIGSDLSIRVFSTVKVDKPEDVTDEQAEVAQVLIALVTVLSYPELLDAAIEVSKKINMAEKLAEYMSKKGE